jgi:hypothetical protein
MYLGTAHADDSQAQARADQTQAADGAKPKPSKSKVAKKSAKAQPKAAEAAPPPPAAAAAPVPAAPVQEVVPPCKLVEAEQPRGGKLDVLADRFGSAPVVRIDGKPARILIRKQDRVSVQIPADSNGGPITLQDLGKSSSCGTLVIIGKDR